MGERFLLLVRHASREVDWRLPEAEHNMQNWGCPRVVDFARPGYPRTAAMTARLAEVLRGEKNVSHVVAIRHSEQKVAEQTAAVMAHLLSHHGLFAGVPEEAALLAPGASRDKSRQELAALWQDDECGAGHDCYTVLIGHQPDLTDMADELLAGRLPAASLPLGGSEIACIRLGAAPRLLWLLTAKESGLLMELKAKLKAKMDVAKFFLGAFVVNTAILLTADLWQSDRLYPQLLALLALLFTVATLVLTAATLFAYDELLMPHALWGGSKNGGGPPAWNIRRPPSQAHMVIFYEMIHVWNVFFIPALISAFAAILLAVGGLVFGQMTAGPAAWTPTPGNLLLLGLLLLVEVGLLLFYFSANRPVLGVDD